MSRETIQQFTDFMRGNSIETTAAIIDDGLLHRFHVIGDKRGSKNGAYILHNDGNPSGWLQHWCSGVNATWSSNGKPRKLTRNELEQIKQERKQRELEQSKAYQQTALKARALWDLSTPATTHPYLTMKGIQAHNARLFGNDLVIALWNEQRAISTLQYIGGDGSKKFLTGGKKKDCFAVIGKPTGTILICEGFATGASLHDDTGNFTVCAMDANNLESVARVIRRLFRNAQIIICGDNDANQVGQNAAMKAAIACGGSYIIPPIEGYDYNDYLTMAGV